MRRCKWCDMPIENGRFCSLECHIMWMRQEKLSQAKTRATVEKVKVDAPSIDEVVEDAEEAGMSYGEYVRRNGI